ncbi:MAG: hypothetical protein WBP40_02940 [Candidatus Moraniibacteriota bacterium]|jgi:hypothetical protein|nr:MAG: hypothetical protein IPJ68_01555 [Candidatus Moranbacteria bacterium]
MVDKLKVRYFLEIKSGESNAVVAAYLAEYCIGEEAWSRNQEDTKGGVHDVCEVPGFKVLKLAQSIARQDSRIRFGYWERKSVRARLSPASFLLEQGKTRRSAKYRRAEAATPPPKSRLTSALR